jgi:hypothetical protein
MFSVNNFAQYETVLRGKILIRGVRNGSQEFFECLSKRGNFFVSLGDGQWKNHFLQERNKKHGL